MRVLVIGPNSDTVRQMQSLLASTGWDIRTACGFDEAKQGARALPPDVVLCEWLMGDSTGADIARSLRRVCPGVPFLFMTSLAADSLVSQAREIPRSLFLLRR